MYEVDRLLQSLVDARRIPSASIVVRVDGREVHHRTVGFARLEPPRFAAENHPYDLASVTKALAGSTTVASFVEQGQIDLDTRVAEHVPDVDDRITVAHLLTHASGYPAWRPLYEQATDAWGVASTREALLRLNRRTPLQTEPGTRHCYSDIGFLVLLDLVERLGGKPFAQLFFERVVAPSGVGDFRWGWPGAAATEQCPVRRVLVEGTVHDLNCASLGGVSTHAGLFAPARAVALLAEQLMFAVLEPDRHPGLPGRALGRFWSLRGPGSHRGGWDSISDGYTATGRFFPSDTVGHLGYTGTSVWVVPSRRTVVALLTNRVHPLDDKVPIREIRPLVHDAVAMALGWATLDRP